MRQEKLYEMCMRYMDELERRKIQVFGFSANQPELRIQTYRAALEDARDSHLVWLTESGFTSKMIPRTVHLIRTRPGVLSEEELQIAREAVDIAHPPVQKPQLKKTSEVADFNLGGLPALKKREGESAHTFAERLYTALHGENDLPRTSSE